MELKIILVSLSSFFISTITELLLFEKSSLQSINTLLATSWLEKNISLINAVKEQPDDEEGKFFVV